jgi:hypothetical protein
MAPATVYSYTKAGIVPLNPLSTPRDNTVFSLGSCSAACKREASEKKKTWSLIEGITGWEVASGHSNLWAFKDA